MDLPDNVQTGIVTGRYIVDVIDGADVNLEPDAVPVQGRIVFTSSVPYLPNPTASPAPVTIMRAPIIGVLDADGYLCTPYPGTLEPLYRGVHLIATDDPDLAVQNWTWDVTYLFDPVGGAKLAIPPHGFSLPSGQTVDLTNVAKVPSSPGYSLPQAEAAALRAEQAAQQGAQDAADALAAALRAEQMAGATDQGVASMLADPATETGQLMNDFLSSKANTTDVNSALSNKADRATTESALSTKADAATVNSALAWKADLQDGVVPVGQLPAQKLVSDENVAGQVNSPQTGAAIDARINTQVTPVVEQITADYIAGDQAVVDAAAAAVDANPKISEIEATAVFDGDSRLLENASTQDLSFAVVDADGRRTWIEADASGNPSKHAAESVGAAIGIESADVTDLSFAVVDSDGRKLWMEADLLGNPTDRVRNLLGIGQGATALPADDWAHWGDSLTDERVLGAEGWVSKLAALTGKDHYNGGWYGQKAGEIAARQGGLPALVTLPGDTIPASGPVTVTAIRNSPVEVHASLGVEGTLAGVHGFMQEPTTDVTTFTRSVSGEPVSCPPGTRFIPDAGTSMRNRVATIWVGRNDVFWTDPRIVVASIRAQIDYMSPSVKRVLVMEVVPSTSSPATHAQLAALNEAIKTAFPVEWVPIATWLRTEEAAVAAGITFTTDDQADIAAGITPTSFRMDGVHLNGTGCTAVASYVFTEAQERGWLA